MPQLPQTKSEFLTNDDLLLNVFLKDELNDMKKQLKMKQIKLLGGKTFTYTAPFSLGNARYHHFGVAEERTKRTR